MESKQYLYYGLGEIAYAIALADGQLERDEELMFHDLIVEEVKQEFDYNISEIIFALLKKEHIASKTTFQWGIKNMKLGEYHFTPEMLAKFKRILEKTADVFHGSVELKNQLIGQFLEHTIDFEGLKN